MAVEYGTFVIKVQTDVISLFIVALLCIRQLLVDLRVGSSKST